MIFCGGCTTTQTVQGLCGSPPNDNVCVGAMTVRKDKVDEFRTASKLAVDGIASEGFSNDLQWFIDTKSRHGAHVPAWTGANDAKVIAASLLSAIRGVSIDTMNDVMGAWYSLFDNKALEGRGNGPILVNPFYGGSAADYANTIAHEAAHRPPLGLKHPHYGGSTTDIGECEPPT